MTHDVPQAPGGEGTSLPLPLLYHDALESLPHPSACKRGHLVGTPGAPKCGFSSTIS